MIRKFCSNWNANFLLRQQMCFEIHLVYFFDNKNKRPFCSGDEWMTFVLCESFNVFFRNSGWNSAIQFINATKKIICFYSVTKTVTIFNIFWNVLWILKMFITKNWHDSRVKKKYTTILNSKPANKMTV